MFKLPAQQTALNDQSWKDLTPSRSLPEDVEKLALRRASGVDEHIIDTTGLNRRFSAMSENYQLANGESGKGLKVSWQELAPEPAANKSNTLRNGFYIVLNVGCTVALTFLNKT